MTIIRPFQGIRPRRELASAIAALPYDVYNTDEARAVISTHPLSFLRIDRAETLLPEGTDMYSPQVYRTARKTLDEMIQNGSFIQDSQCCYYIYSLTMNGKTQTGIVGCASADDYVNGIILKHENTLPAKEADRINHIEACSAQTGPIFLTCRPCEKLHRITDNIVQAEPIYDFTCDDNVRHRVWIVDHEKEIKSISEIFSEIPHLYIADGHHRAASAVNVALRRREKDPGFSGTEEYNFFLSVIFPADELSILDYNRVVTNMKGYTFEEFLDMIKDGFDITDVGSAAYHPKCKGEFGLYGNGSWYCLKAKPSLLTDDPVDSLDVSVLQNHIFSPILQIRDPKTDPGIRFVGGIRGTDILTKMADASGGAAFTLYPTSMDELLRVADSGRLMPPKSTWFEPKLRSGLFIHRF